MQLLNIGQTLDNATMSLNVEQEGGIHPDYIDE